MKYQDCPELIATVETIDCDGDATYAGEKIIGIGVRQDSSMHREGTVDIDVRDFKRGVSLVIRLPLPELVAAIATATLNAQRDK